MTSTAQSLVPLAGAWKQTFHLATHGSTSYTKGLNLARNGAVAQIQTQHGTISAPVAAKKATHRATIHLPELTTDQWEKLTARLADDPQAVADLLANRIPATIADSGHAGGISIVPPADHITFSCSCPTGRAHHVCDHSAALGHTVAERLATTPSLLFGPRGMTIRALAARVRDLVDGADPGHLPADTNGTVRAAQLYSLAAHRPPQTEPDLSLDTTDPPTWTDAPHPGPRAQDLTRMTADASARARALLAGAATAEPHDELADILRILASPDGPEHMAAAQHATGVPEATLRAMMIGYRHGGPAGAHATLAPAPTAPDLLEQARATAQTSRAAGLGTLTADSGAVTDTTAGVQIRPGPDGRWHPFTLWRADEWRPAPGACDDPAEAFRAARRARATRPNRR
ncbi:hypothetical protein [Streptomyces clavuligerus]|uniref:hypothetical protein n=1 Tax=Streptomyces clavuligerus TaxID=1901 RepID=UPI00018009E9|nr:hypothetical protein [Streptomyces clavuligerus]EDY52703.1 hypothetical protein SSCG_05731 [Streptomyces clavuligerus]WDN55888.1 hypothetical protein LL058_28740 [Streptomyces clavuligerus]